MMFEYIPPSLVPAVWETCRPLLAKAFRNMVHVNGVDDYYDPLLNGDMQLWVAHNKGDIIGSVVTSIEFGSQANALRIFSLGGEEIRDWIDDLERELTAFAKANNCKVVEAITRPGFSRLVPNFVEDGRLYVKVMQ